MRCIGAPGARRYQAIKGGARLVALAAIWPLTGCLVDEKCDANQVYIDDNHQAFCACAPNAIKDAKGYGCTLCGENEETKNGTSCECKVGFAKQGGSTTCAAVTGQVLGAPCTGAGTCAEPYPFCATDGAAQYCTDQCTAKSDCEGGYRCQGGFCEKVDIPSAQCATNADCAGSDATFCLTIAKACLINGCAADTKLCPTGMVCCTFMDLDSCAPGPTCPIGTLVP
jgi:hypothetical protein